MGLKSLVLTPIPEISEFGSRKGQDVQLIRVSPVRKIREDGIERDPGRTVSRSGQCQRILIVLGQDNIVREFNYLASKIWGDAVGREGPRPFNSWRTLGESWTHLV